MKSELQTFGAQLAHMIRPASAGNRMQSASGGATLGDRGASEVSTRDRGDGTTQREWMVGDPMGAGAEGYFFKDFRDRA